MPPRGPGATMRRMTSKRYAAVWADNGDATVGSLVLDDHALTFDGRDRHETLEYSEIDSFELDRSRNGRLAGRASLVLLIGKRRVRLAIPETGALPELVTLLGAFMA